MQALGPMAQSTRFFPQKSTSEVVSLTIAPVSLKIRPSNEPRKMTRATLVQVLPKPEFSVDGIFSRGVPTRIPRVMVAIKSASIAWNFNLPTMRINNATTIHKTITT